MFPCSGGFVARSCLILASPWGLDRQAPLSMEFPRKEYWSGLLFPSPGDLLNPGIEPRSPILHADSLPAESQRKPQGDKGRPKRLYIVQSSFYGIYERYLCKDIHGDFTRR